MTILINDILCFENIENVKIRFNKKNNDNYDPIKFFKEDKQKLLDGQFWNGEIKSFTEGQIAIGFAKIDGNKWLLFDISKITKDLEKYNAVGYEYKIIEKYEKYLGRLIIEFNNNSQNLIRKANTVIDRCKVIQILEDKFDNDIFPGYENVRLTWFDLKRVINKSSWDTALRNQKGIYLITDKNTGKMYVGSAYGNNMLLGRWKDYISSCHGNNTKFKNLNNDYIKNNFSYSILDIYKSTINDNIIIEREIWWKETLQTRKFGYNDN